MSYLIDGNNVMAQRVGWHRDKTGARRGLLDDLAGFAASKRVRISVVFDGAPEQFFADGSSYKGVRVHYAVRGSDADERIKGIVEASRERRTLIVITSDRALSDYVHRCGARVVSAGDFRRRMDEAAANTQQLNKPSAAAPATAAELNKWMRYFGVDSETDQSDE